jgi:hypothetical protein
VIRTTGARYPRLGGRQARAAITYPDPGLLPGPDVPDLTLSRKVPQSWGEHVSVPPLLFLESRTRTYFPSHATSTHSLPLTPDLVLFRQVSALSRPGAAVSFFLGAQEEACRIAVLLMSTRVDSPPRLAILRKSSRRPEKVSEASGGTSVLTRPGPI